MSYSNVAMQMIIEDMNKEQKKRVYKKLDEQIVELANDIAGNFVFLSESLGIMRSTELYKSKYPKRGFKGYLSSIRDDGIDPSTAYKLIRIYELFGPYNNSIKNMFLLHEAGWTKPSELAKHKEEIRDALTIGFLRREDLSLYARKESLSEISSFLENHQPPRMWDKIFMKTHNMRFKATKGPSRDILLNILITIKSHLSETFTREGRPLSINHYFKRVNFNYLTNSELRKFIGHLRNIAQHFCLIVDLEEGDCSPLHDMFLSKNRDSVLGRQKKAAIRPPYSFLKYDANNISIKKMLQTRFLEISALSQLTDVPVTKLQDWIKNGYLSPRPEFKGKNTTDRPFSLRIARKVEKMKENIDSGMHPEKAAEEASEIINEEKRFKIIKPYSKFKNSVTYGMRHLNL